MATQVKEKERTTAAEELAEAIRQAERRITSAKPSMRLIQQKMKKVTEMEEKLRLCHNEYCNAAGIALDSAETREKQNVAEISLTF